MAYGSIWVSSGVQNGLAGRNVSLIATWGGGANVGLNAGSGFKFTHYCPPTYLYTQVQLTEYYFSIGPQYWHVQGISIPTWGYVSPNPDYTYTSAQIMPWGGVQRGSAEDRWWPYQLAFTYLGSDPNGTGTIAGDQSASSNFYQWGQYDIMSYTQFQAAAGYTHHWRMDVYDFYNRFDSCYFDIDIRKGYGTDSLVPYAPHVSPFPWYNANVLQYEVASGYLLASFMPPAGINSPGPYDFVSGSTINAQINTSCRFDVTVGGVVVSSITVTAPTVTIAQPTTGGQTTGTVSLGSTLDWSPGIVAGQINSAVQWYCPGGYFTTIGGQALPTSYAGNVRFVPTQPGTWPVTISSPYQNVVSAASTVIVPAPAQGSTWVPVIDHVPPSTNPAKPVYAANEFDATTGVVAIATTNTPAQFTMDGSAGAFYLEGVNCSCNSQSYCPCNVDYGCGCDVDCQE